MDYNTIAADAPQSLTQDRWSDGIDHHPMSEALMDFLAKHDFKDYKDYFCWKTGGDGDNGETLKYQMDPFFEWLDRQAAAKAMDASYIVDGQVAVLYRPQYGIGWSSHPRDPAHKKFLALNGQLARLVEAKNWEKVTELVQSRYPDSYLGSVELLQICWMPVGSLFEITEHDGYEQIEVKSNDFLLAV